MATRVMATTWVMATAMKLEGDKKAREVCKGNDNGNVRVAGDEEGKGSKATAMAMATRMVGKWSATAMKRVIATATRVAGKPRQLRQRERW